MSIFSTGLGPTTGWKLIKEGRLQVVRITGIDRTFVVYDSLMGLLRSSTTSAPQPRRRVVALGGADTAIIAEQGRAADAGEGRQLPCATQS